MNHEEEAKRLFTAGYSCAQAVFCAFRDMTGMDIDTAARLSSSFGAGMGRMRQVCGAVSGALMVLGFVRGYDDPENTDAKHAHYSLVQEYAGQFREKNGSIICRELLESAQPSEGVKPEERTSKFYSRRPCLRLTGDAAAILDSLLTEYREGE